MSQITWQTVSMRLQAAGRSSVRMHATPSTSLAVKGNQARQSSQRFTSTSSSLHQAVNRSLRQKLKSGSSWKEQSHRSWRRDHHLLFAARSRIINGQASGHRAFSSSAIHLHGGKGRPAPGTGIKVTFMNSKGEVIKTVEGNEGDDIVDLSWEYDLDIEAACEKSIACSTCHVILDPESFDKLEEPSDEENDMLDMAFGLEDTSRLGCQVKLTREVDGMTVKLPSATRNFAVDGHKSKH